MGVFYILGIIFLILLLPSFSKYYKELAWFSLFPLYIAFILGLLSTNLIAKQVSMIDDYHLYKHVKIDELNQEQKLDYYNRINDINNTIIRHQKLKDSWFCSCLSKPELYNLELIPLNI